MAIVMVGPFREMPDVLGAQERESEAIRTYGRWQMRLRTIVLATFTISGLIPAGAAYYALYDDYSVRGSMFFASFVWLGVILAGAWVSKQVVRERSPAKVAELARAYEVPVRAIAETVALTTDLY